MNNNTFNNNAVIYTRFSSQSQDKQTTEVQLKACREFAEKHGYNVIEEYSDEACTGKNDRRPAFRKMLKDSEKGQFQFVIVYKYDRFARNIRLSLNYEAELEARGIITLSTIEPYSNDANGKLMRGMNYLIAEFYSNDYAQRIQKGLENTSSKYQSTGGQRSLGYKTKDKKFTIVKNEAIAVQKIFEMYASGENMATIINYMNELGFKTANGNSFNKNSIHRILTNKRYIGTYVFKDIEVPNKIPRIISDELFNEVQIKMAQNKLAPARARAKTEYLLTTKLFCGHCRNAMVGSSGTSRNGTLHTYYKCKSVMDKQCDKKSVPKDYIEDLVINSIRKFLTDKNIEKIANNVVKLFQKQQDMYIIKNLKDAINGNQTKMNNLVASLSETTSESVRKVLLEKIADVEKETNSLEKELAKQEKKQLDITVDNIKYFLSGLRDGYVDTPKYRKTLINALVNRIYLYDDKMIIIINTQNESVDIDLTTLLDIESVLISQPMVHHSEFKSIQGLIFYFI